MIKQILAHLPSKLPQGKSEFDVWADDIIETYNMPNNDSIKFALATAVMHLSATDAFKPKAYFGRILIKGASNQVVYAIMQELKVKQEEKARKDVEEQKQLAEATAQSNESGEANEQQKDRA